MIRRHATWMLIHPRSATFISRLPDFGEVSTIAKIRCCVHCWGPFGLAQRLGGSGGRGATALPVIRGSALIPWKAAVAGRPPYRRTAMERRPYRFGHAGRVTLPCGRDGARPSRGFGPVAGTWCRFSPRDRVTKSRTRRCQRSVLRSPSQFLSKGTRESIPHSPTQRKRGFWEVEVSRAVGM